MEAKNEDINLTARVAILLEPLEVIAVINGLNELPRRISEPLVQKIMATARKAQADADKVVELNARGADAA